MYVVRINHSQMMAIVLVLGFSDRLVLLTGCSRATVIAKFGNTNSQSKLDYLWRGCMEWV